MDADQTTHSWYALQVRTRHEKTVAAALRGKGFAEFLPLYKSRRQWSQRVAEVELPLFPGYVFCSFDPGDKRVLIATTPGVIGLVGFGGKAAPVDRAEIEAIHRVLRMGIAAEPWKYMESGRRVRVVHGALAGLEGIFVEAQKHHRLLLSVSLLQRSVAIQIDSAWVVPVNTAMNAMV